MKEKDRVIISKILKYIDELNEFISGYSEEDFMNDKKTINACVFNLGQIGELAGKLSEEITSQNTYIEWRGLRGLRNRIVHDYDGLNLSMIWDFLNSDLPELKINLNKIIK